MSGIGNAALLAGCAAALTGMKEPPTGTVTVTITEMRSTQGVVRACMTTNREIFPRCRKDPASHRTVVTARENMTLTFTGVKPGNYAIALLHDETIRMRYML